MDLDEEIRPIKGFDKYFVSNKGNVYSICYKKIKLLKQGWGGNSKIKYKRVYLSRDKKIYAKSIHRLVLETFLGDPPPGTEACHGPKGTLDNSIENLSWKTRKENNSIDKIRDGKLIKGSAHYRSKITERDALFIKSLLKENYKPKYIASIIGVTLNIVISIKYNNAWKWLDEPQKQFDGK